MKRWLITAAVLMAAPACDGEPAPDPMADPGSGRDDGPPMAGDDVPSEPSDVLRSAHALPQTIGDEGQSSAEVTTNSVWMASQLAGQGQVVTTGTLVQQGDGFAYDPEPRDALVVSLSDGTRVVLVVHAMEGDVSGTPGGFLDGDHRLEYEVAVPDRLDMRFGSQRLQGSASSSAVGSYTHQGQAYDVDLERIGSYYFESDSTGTHYRDEHRTTGTVQAEGYRLEVDEGWRYELVTSGDDSASTAQRTVSSGLTVGGTVYDWVDVVTRKSFRDGQPSQTESYWTAEGAILRDGEGFGQYGMELQGPYLRFVVALPAETIEVEQHPLY